MELHIYQKSEEAERERKIKGKFFLVIIVIFQYSGLDDVLARAIIINQSTDFQANLSLRYLAGLTKN